MADETVYKITVDTESAQQNVDKLEDTSKRLDERLESLGGSGKNIGDGISTGVGSGLSALERLGGAVGFAEDGIGALGSAAAAAGAATGTALSGAGNAAEHLSGSLGIAAAEADAMGTSGERAGDAARRSFKNAADSADSMGRSFAKNFTAASVQGASFGKSIKQGVAGAFDTAKTKVTGFVQSAVSGGKKVGNAFVHPLATIKDKFSSTMKSAAKSTETVGDKAKKSGKGLESMGKSGAAAGENMKRGLEGALKVVAAVAAAAAVVTGLVKFAGAADNASRSANMASVSVNQAFGENAPEVTAWADNFADAIHRSDTEVKKFLTSNQGFYQSMGVTGKAAEDLSKVTTSLAYDFGNFAGISDADALAQIQDAIFGNEKALSAYGVSLDKATLASTAMKMGLGSNIDEMDSASLAQVRLNAVLEQSEGIQKNASESMGGAAGGIKALKAGFTDFLESAGTKLAPSIEKLFGAILEQWPKLEPALLMLVDLLANGLAGAGPVIGMVGDMLAGLMGGASSLAPELSELGGTLFPMLGQIAGDLGEVALPLLSQVLGTVSSTLKPLAPLFEVLTGTVLPPLANIVGMLVETLLPPLGQLLGALAPILSALAPVLEVAGAGIGLVANAIATLIGWITKGIEKIGEFAQSLKDSAVGKFVSGIGEGISSFTGKVFGGNAKGTDNFPGGWTKVHEAGGEIIQAKYGEGVAYLPKGSAVIPASQSKELLSGELGSNVIDITGQLPSPVVDITLPPVQNTVGNVIDITGQLPSPVVDIALPPVQNTVGNVIDITGRLPAPAVETLPQSGFSGRVLDFETHHRQVEAKNDIGYPPVPIGVEPEDPPDDNPLPQKPPPPPEPKVDNPEPRNHPVSTEHIERRVIELKIEVSSPDGSVPPEMLEEVRRIAKEAVREEREDELSALAIQNGYAS